jgi:hypothetical protein
MRASVQTTSTGASTFQNPKGVPNASCVAKLLLITDPRSLPIVWLRPHIYNCTNQNQPMPKLNCIFGLSLGALLLAAGISCTKVTKDIDVYDGFETAGLSKVWDTDRFIPGAVQMQTNIFRAGHGAAKITVHAKDKFEAGLNGDSDSERAELLEAEELISSENKAYEFSFSMLIPTNFPIVPTRLIVAQWKQRCTRGGNCSNESPVLAVRYISGVLRITQDIGKSKSHTTLYQEQGEFRGRWLDFKFQVRFSTNETGRVKAWLGDKQVVDYQGVTANPENAVTGYPSPSRFYFKMGLYRDVLPEPWTIYVDEYRKKELPEGGP